MRHIIGQDGGLIIHPVCDHSGRIREVTYSDKDCGGDLLFAGDAFIADVSQLTTGIVHGVIRTRDCVPMLGFAEGHIFGIHVSNQTEFGYYPDKIFQGPIIKRVLSILDESGIKRENCQLFVGPSIAGVNAECECYDYTNTPHQADGEDLVLKIRQHYPDLDLTKFIFRRYDSNKLYFHWGAMIIAILQLLGIPKKNIHSDYNHCTLCQEGWWSDRRFRKSTNPETQKLYEELKPSNLAWISRM